MTEHTFYLEEVTIWIFIVTLDVITSGLRKRIRGINLCRIGEQAKDAMGCESTDFKER